LSDRSQDFETLSADARARLESIIERFEDARQRGERPDLAEYLPKHDSDRLHVLTELVHVDLEMRLKAGEPARVEEYLADAGEHLRHLHPASRPRGNKAAGQAR
jgi:hypothetical protein